ncbi:hypothetical protein D3C76_1364370 [compost metagenome]
MAGIDLNQECIIRQEQMLVITITEVHPAVRKSTILSLAQPVPFHRHPEMILQLEARHHSN